MHTRNLMSAITVVCQVVDSAYICESLSQIEIKAEARGRGEKQPGNVCQSAGRACRGKARHRHGSTLAPFRCAPLERKCGLYTFTSSASCIWRLNSH